MKRKIQVILALVLSLSILAGCGNDEKAIMEVIEKYISAVNTHDIDIMSTCIDPEIRDEMQDQTNNIGDIFGIQNMFGFGMATGEILMNMFEDQTGYDIDLEFVEVQNEQYGEDTARMEILYECQIKRGEEVRRSIDTVFVFNMVKREKDWYISGITNQR